MIRQPDLQGLLQGIYNGQQTGIQGDFTIFAPNNDAMARLNRRNEDPAILWKYHIVPGVYTDQVIYNLAQERFSQTTPQQATGARPQNNLGTMALPFQVRKKTFIEHFFIRCTNRFSMVLDTMVVLVRTSISVLRTMQVEQLGYHKHHSIKVISMKVTID